MTPSEPSPLDERISDGSKAGLARTRQELEIITRRLSGRPRAADGYDVAPSPPPLPVGEAAPVRRSQRARPEQVAALTVFGVALSAFLMGALASMNHEGSSNARVAATPPVTGGRAATSRPASRAGPAIRAAPRRAAEAAVADREAVGEPAPSGDGGETAVRAFYHALGRGDGGTASALVVAEKRSAQAFSPQAISRFYGRLPEPLRLTSITPIAGGAYRVTYRYSAGRSPCDGAAVVSVASRDGRNLIRSIKALNGC